MWAVEGCQGVGRHLAQRLVADGGPVVDVPAKLSARARVFSTGQGRKTDETDAHSVAVVALRTPRLARVRVDDETVALRLLADRRDELGAARTLTVSRLHRLLTELVPGGAKKFLSAMQAKALLSEVQPADVVAATRVELAVELLAELDAIDARVKTAKRQLTELVKATGSSLLDLNGIGPSGTARLLGDIGDVSRFPTKGHFASWNGPRPSTPRLGTSAGTGCPGPGTGGSTGCCTSWRSSSCVTTPKAAATSTANAPKARARWRRCARSSAGSPTWSIASS
nr:transposase [Motilibacter aurantiacus]